MPATNGSHTLDHGTWTSALAEAERQAGFREGLAQNKRDVARQLVEQLHRVVESDLDRAKHASEEIFRQLQKQLDVTCKRIYLRSSGFRSFDAVFFVSADDFESEGFDEAYDIGWEQADILAQDGYEYDFSFAALGGDIKHQALLADEYITWYVGSREDTEDAN